MAHSIQKDITEKTSLSRVIRIVTYSVVIAFCAFLFFMNTNAFSHPLTGSSNFQDIDKVEKQSQENPAQEVGSSKLLDIQEVKSSHGISAWLVEDHSVPVIAMQFAFKGAGAKLDPAEKQGLARLTSNTLDEGAGDLDSQEFQKELQDLSIDLRFESSRDDFSGVLKTLTKNKKRAFELMKLTLREPRFDKEPLERMRAANKSRIRSSLSNPNWLAARLLNDKIYEGHPYAFNSGGTLSSLDNITQEDLHNFVKARLGKNVLKISVAGDITKEELESVLDDIFSDLPDVTLPSLDNISIQNPGKTFLYQHDIPQTIVEIMQEGLEKDHPDYFIAKVMNFVLGGSGFGSRLTEEVREKRGLSYGIYSYFLHNENGNGFAVSASTSNKNVPQILKVIKEEWDKMQNTFISDQELDDAKAYLIGALPLSLTSTDKIAGQMLALQLKDLPSNYLSIREEAIRAVTKEDIQEFSQRLLDEDNFVTVLVGNPSEETKVKIEKNNTVLQIVEKLPHVE